ncbi:cupredoxin domain-containing protein [Acidovorax sp. SRB_24]|uniref:cupredoxin domain-containing protein n=1 Tax=Acidovorax sp. SRB_24 TaxID=1962700 RepID=UPI00145CEA99|nr:cupredoxin family protein [Acidovorax sp. SRB_24]NMM77479.1 hypothetical protein [Acidovorax sp. SRB_24]
MKTIKFIAACALLVSAGATFGHEGATHAPAHAAEPAKEQTAWGIAGDAAAVQRTITLRMTDAMRFEPNHIEVREGDTVRLRVENQGRLMHEIVLGTQADLDAHAEMMRKHPGMEHDAPSMAHVAPGKQGDIVWQFNRPGNFDFACLIEGHYQAGMTGTITVRPRAR